MTLPNAFVIYAKLHQNYLLLNENRCHHSMPQITSTNRWWEVRCFKRCSDAVTMWLFQDTTNNARLQFSIKEQLSWDGRTDGHKYFGKFKRRTTRLESKIQEPGAKKRDGNVEQKMVKCKESQHVEYGAVRQIGCPLPHHYSGCYRSIKQLSMPHLIREMKRSISE